MAEAPPPSALSPYSRGAIGVHGAAIASPLTVLLFRRAEVAENLDLLGAIVGEATMIALAAVLASLLVPRWRNRLPAGLLLALGAATATVGLGLMSWTIEGNLFLIGGLLFAVGSAPGLVLHRLLLSVHENQPARLRTVSQYWAAVAVGVGWPLAAEILWDPEYQTLLWVAFALMFVATLSLMPVALFHDDDIETEPTAGRADVPWVKRSLGAAFGGGAVVVGGADPAIALLTGEWQRSPEQTAAVLAVAPAAAALALMFGPWYHRLGRLRSSQRADVIGTQLLAAGVLVFIGGLSFTYIGLIVSWGLAGGAVGYAAAGLDTALFPSLAPTIRRAVAARQVVFAALGAATATFVNGWIIEGWSDQWKIALTGLPLMVVGFLVRRNSDSPMEKTATLTAAAATSVPRRVEGLSGETHALLKVENLDVSYGSVQVLFGVDLAVDEGEVVALLGTNGAGKTTLLRAISGLEPTLNGRVLFAGLDVTKTRPTWRVGMGLHQIVGGEAVVDPLTVADNLRLFSHTVPAEERDAGIRRALDLFPVLEQRLEQRAATLSGGEKQMLALSKAIIVKPRVLLIDEFSLGLAPLVVSTLLPVVRQLADDGAGVLLVEQSVNVALSVADRAYVIEKGEIGFTGDAASLRDQPDLLRAAYLEGLTKALER